MIKHGQVGDWRLGDDDFLRTFHLPTSQDKVEALKDKHAFPTDTQIVFDEESHTYTVDGIVASLSVTGLIHQHAHEFDPGEAIRGMRPETRQMYTELGMTTDDEIIRSWSRNGDVQRKRGTLMHYQIEQHLNGCTIEAPWSQELGQYMHLRDVAFADQEPYRTELSVYSRSLDVAGQIDAIFKQTDGTFTIWDWKRSKLLRYDNRTQMREPFEHMSDANYSHYALQLNIYRFILQTEYNLTVSGLFLGVFHPSRSQPLCVRVPFLDDEMESLIECHKQNICSVSVQTLNAMPSIFSLVAAQAHCTEKQARAVCDALRGVLLESLKVSNRKIRVPGLLSAVVVQTKPKPSRSKKVFGTLTQLPPKAASKIVRLVPSSKLQGKSL